MDFDDKPQENPLLSLAPDSGVDVDKKQSEDNPYLSMMQFDLKSKVEKAVTIAQEVKEELANKDVDILEFNDQTVEEKEEEDLLYGSNPFDDIFGSKPQNQSKSEKSSFNFGELKDKAGSLIKSTPNPLKAPVVGKLVNMVVSQK